MTASFRKSPAVAATEHDTAGDRWLLLKGRSGMGNRMLAAITAILYAQLSGRRLAVDWSDYTYSHDRSNVFSRYFSCPADETVAFDPAGEDIVPTIWRGRLDRSVTETELEPGLIASDWPGMKLDLTRLDYPERIAVYWGHFDQIGLLRPSLTRRMPELGRLPTWEVLRRVLRSHLMLDAAVRTRVDAFKRQHFESETIGMHVRFTDKRVDVARLKRALDRLAERKPRARIFLATDSSVVQRNFEAELKNLVSTPHWYPPPRSSPHQNPTCPDRFEQGLEALTDLYLLAECDHLIGDSRSSFYYVAMLLSDLPRSRMFDPHPYHGRYVLARRLAWHALAAVGFLRWGRAALRASLVLQRLYDD
jgi:hypothetical protein